ncbi:hypothetical protein ACFJXP_11190 [Enterococcus faecalis]
MKYIKKVQTRMMNLSIENGFFKVMIYTVLPLLLTMIFVLEIVIVNWTFRLDNSEIMSLLVFIITILFLFLAIILFVFFLQLSIKFLKNHYIQLPLLLLPTLISLFMIVLFWLYAVLAYVNNFLWSLLGHVSPSFLKDPYFNMDSVLDALVSISRVMFIIYIPLAISFMLNTLLPEELQVRNISFKQKLYRLFLKFAYLVLIIFITYIFSIIDKENFGTISIFSTLFTFACTPKTILRVFSNIVNIEEKQISEEIYRKFDTAKFLYYEMIFAWSIAIYIVDAKTLNEKVMVFAISFFALIVITIGIKVRFEKHGNKLFSKWIINGEKNIESTKDIKKQ